jgi:transposase InsO family protein
VQLLAFTLPKIPQARQSKLRNEREEVYLNDYQTVADAAGGLARYFRLYNEERLHQALGHRTPASVFVARGG